MCELSGHGGQRPRPRIAGLRMQVVGSEIGVPTGVADLGTPRRLMSSTGTDVKAIAVVCGAPSFIKPDDLAAQLTAAHARADLLTTQRSCHGRTAPWAFHHRGPRDVSA